MMREKEGITYRMIKSEGGDEGEMDNPTYFVYPVSIYYLVLGLHGSE